MNTITLHDQTFAYQGDASMLLCPLTTFLCSHRVPDGVSAAVREWVNGLSTSDSCVVCGTLTADERFASRLLLERGIPVVLALAQSIPDDLSGLRLEAIHTTALADGRLVIISPIVDSSVSEVSSKTSASRNQLMINIAEKIVVGYMTENGNLARQLLGRHNVTVLKTDGHYHFPETDVQQREYNETRMGWTIWQRLKEGNPDTENSESDAPLSGEMPWESTAQTQPAPSPSGPLSSLEMRQLLAQYIKLQCIPRPSLLHSLILYQVVKGYATLPDFNFTAFLRLWGIQNLRPEDWRVQKINGHWMPSLADRVLTRLFKALPSRFNTPPNPRETFDPELAHGLVEEAQRRMRRPGRKLWRKALSLAYHEHDSEAIARYRKLLGREGSDSPS